MTMQNTQTKETQVVVTGGTINLPSSAFEMLLNRAFGAQESQIAILQAENAQLRANLAAIPVAGTTAVKSGRYGRKESQPQIDTKTGTFYRTKSLAGLAVCEEYGLSKLVLDKATKQPVIDARTGKPKINTFIWYKVLDSAPNRFRPATEEEITIYNTANATTNAVITVDNNPAVQSITANAVKPEEAFTEEDLDQEI